LINKELEGCSFKPTISTYNPPNNKSYQNLQKSANHIFSDISQKIKTHRVKNEEINKEEKEMKECTFKPNLGV